MSSLRRMRGAPLFRLLIGYIAMSPPPKSATSKQSNTFNLALSLRFR